MKTNSWNKIDWRYAMNKAKKPFLYIARSFGRYSLTQDDKTPKYLSGKKK